ncbi:MAG: DUF3502 domain-containing protein [Lachnospiraceae bacterium]|nr:DUF3502 domain-containing protein [Lachnospiraceae bacterium]
MKKETMKKGIALTLALCTVLGTFIGCGSQTGKSTESTAEKSSVSGEPKETEEVSSAIESETEPEVELEPVTLKWFFCAGEQEGSADVVEAFNAKLTEVLPNTTVEFVFNSDYNTNYPMALAGGEEMDIAWDGYKTPFYQNVLDGSIMGLSELINEYAPNLVKEMEIWESSYESCTLDGEIYGVPSIQPNVKESQAWRVDLILEPYLDIDALMEEFHSNTKATAKMADIFEAAVKAAIDDGAIKVGDTSWFIDASFANWGTFGYLELGNNIFYDANAENPVPLHLWEIPEVKMFVEYYAKWYDWGWITDTQLIGGLPSGSRSLLYANTSYNQNWSDANEIGVKNFEKDIDGYPKLMLLTNRPEDGYIGVNTFGSAKSYAVIPYTSKNPERAMMLLNVLHDEVGTVGNDLLNMLIYGFEEKSDEAKKYGWCNYTAVEEDGQLRVDTSVRNGAGSKHSVTAWKIANTFKSMHDGGVLTTTASKEYAMNFYVDVYPNMKRTVLAGMFVDTSDVSLAIENMSTVWAEYKEQIYSGCGGVDKVDALMETALNKIMEAGLNEVKVSLQEQIDAYISQ